MGILDTIRSFFGSTESGPDANASLRRVEQAAKNEMFTEASLHAFYALEDLSEAYAQHKREPHITAREFANLISEDSVITKDDLEPIIFNFEIAKYSEMDISGDDYSKTQSALDTVAQKFKSGKVKKSTAKERKRRRPRRGGRTGRARSREDSEEEPKKRRRRRRRR